MSTFSKLETLKFMPRAGIETMTLRGGGGFDPQPSQVRERKKISETNCATGGIEPTTLRGRGARSDPQAAQVE